ncbi:MAG: PIN domain-containing protein [Gemmatimonadaceae bacterium]|nr:PIN domain-containing protein [Gemmatimonadaceae bacterium]
MSVTVDANILIYASNARDPAHARARTVVEQLGAGPRLVYLFWPTVLAYLRIVTSPSILSSPISPTDAQDRVEQLITRRHVRTPGELDGFWPVLRDAAGPTARGNELPDAQLVALMRQHGVETIYTRDRDFRRYEGIRVVDPFD